MCIIEKCVKFTHSNLKITTVTVALYIIILIFYLSPIVSSNLSLSLSLSLSLYEDNNKQKMKNDCLNKIWVMLTSALKTMINNLF